MAFKQAGRSSQDDSHNGVLSRVATLESSMHDAGNDAPESSVIHNWALRHVQTNELINTGLLRPTF